ncbi:MAG: tRNA 2-thiouridine(34) synthase MnmA [Fretibacterium sp.]|nr:tRNA 2-thiouridine(34) synthase MnmA [Fretibacterium sp.]
MGRGALIAMSGGVDSSAAACLAVAEGYACVGATMRLFLNGDVGLSPSRPCCSQRDIDDAASVSALLGIPHEVLNCMVDFKLRVIDKFIRTYELGGTPNPCIDCNRYLKFEGLLSAARERGLDFIVTGHYARIERAASGRFLLKKAADSERDQSYVLYMLTQEQLAHTLFPLGGMTKAEVRALAEARGFVNAHKRDSQDICFVPDGDYAAFIERTTGRPSPPGDFVSPEGRVLGRHKGIIHYTIGQRRGLGVAGGARLYVSAINPAANTVTLCGEQGLFVRSVTAKDVNFISVPALDGPARVTAKVRYRQREVLATAAPVEGGKLRVMFDEPQRAPAIGQAVVLYDGDAVVAGGTIEGWDRGG